VAVYSIKDLEKLSGIKAHTIRMWEKRYTLLEPQRTDSNIRFYTDDDLRMLLNITFLVKRNYKISKIAKMSHEEVEREVQDLSAVFHEPDMQLDALTISLIEMDQNKFENILQINIDDLGFERAMFDVVYPFLDKLSLLWMSGSIKPVQESYMTQLIKKKLFVALEMDDFPQPRNPRRAMVFLPQGENQELSLLFVQYLLQKRGIEVHNLGMNIRYTDAIHAYELIKPDFAFTIFNEVPQGNSTFEFIAKFSSQLNKIPLYVTGYYAFTQIVNSPSNVTIAPSLAVIFDKLGLELAEESPTNERSN
jgi:MerR family transcriptional regulator, light-induced transcriptional regulator